MALVGCYWKQLVDLVDKAKPPTEEDIAGCLHLREAALYGKALNGGVLLEQSDLRKLFSMISPEDSAKLLKSFAHPVPPGMGVNLGPEPTADAAPTPDNVTPIKPQLDS